MLKNLPAYAGETIFKGYDMLSCTGRVMALFNKAGQSVDVLQDEQGIVVLDQTPFYAESGGQVGDVGVLQCGSSCSTVTDTQKSGNAFVHVVQVQGQLTVGDTVNAEVDAVRRQMTMYNHSATHLLNAALRSVLGPHVVQKGSLVGPDYLRFDFSHDAPLTQAESDRIEALVNEAIMSDLTVTTMIMGQAQAKAAGALSLAGEKYADEVRVLRMGEFSKELCGGTHVASTGDILRFKITAESGIASGVRRIVAVTHDAVDEYIAQKHMEKNTALTVLKNKHAQLLLQVRDLERLVGIDDVGISLPAQTETVDAALLSYQQGNRDLEKRLERAKAKQVAKTGGVLSDKAVVVRGVSVLVEQLEGVDSKSLRDTMDQLKHKLKSAVIILATVNDGKVQLVAGVTDDQTQHIKAGDLAGMLALQVGGKGGGRADMAQAGGSDIGKLSDALQSALPWIESRLK
jgi:alanyl-tRNA synthetase